VVALQPPVVAVKVNEVLPYATPVTIPALVTVATAGSLLTQVPPVVGDNWVTPFLSMVVGPVKATTGEASEVMFAVLLVAVQVYWLEEPMT